MDTEVKRRGRPTLPSTERKSANLKFRTRGDLRRRLEEAASANGRSVSEEVEYRLLHSFTVNEIRQIVREEIAAASLAPIVHTVTGVSAHRVRPEITTQIFGRDHLPS